MRCPERKCPAGSCIEVCPWLVSPGCAGAHRPLAAGGDPQYGIVELAADGGRYPDTVSVLTGDPMAMSVQRPASAEFVDVRLVGTGHPAEQDRRRRS